MFDHSNRLAKNKCTSFYVIKLHAAFKRLNCIDFYANLLYCYTVYTVTRHLCNRYLSYLRSALANRIASNSIFASSSAKSANVLQTKARSLPQFGFNSMWGRTICNEIEIHVMQIKQNEQLQLPLVCLDLPKWLAQILCVLSLRMSRRHMPLFECFRIFTFPVPRSFHSAGSSFESKRNIFARLNITEKYAF